jgi:formylglycine-generating enzyme required for sulfatase activity
VNAAADPRDCPYVGLDPFESAHASYFFGRRRESKIIADHVLARPVTVLYGPSGVGKSSILNVGLPAALEEIAAAARDEFDEGGPDAPGDAAETGYGDFFIRQLRTWQEPEEAERAMAGWAAGAASRPLLVVLDQFEEYFLYRDRNRMSALDRAFGQLIARRDLPVHLLISVRDDALHQLDQLRAFIPGILETTIELRGLSEAAVREAILGPVARYNETHRGKGAPILVEDALVATLIRQLKQADTEFSRGRSMPGEERRIELPYLQLALTKLWTAEGGASATAFSESTLVDRLGGVGRIVRDHVNGVMGALSAGEQALCAKMFDRLVTPIGGKIAYPTAGLATAEVVGPNVTEPGVEAVLSKLTPKQARILKPVTTNGLPGFEIFHDVLGLPVLEWKRDFEAREKEAALAREARRPMRFFRALAYAALVAIIIGLIGWINQSELKRQWQWYAITRPFRQAKILPHVLTAQAEGALKPGDAFRECAVEPEQDYCPAMIVVPSGSFLMGSPQTEPNRYDDEGPQHEVTIAQPFAVSKFELTFDEWDACADKGDCAQGIPDSGWGRGMQPLINITFEDAQRYVAWLAAMTGKPYRLLSEAEYEYATRAGTQTIYPWGNEVDTNRANCGGCGSRWDGKQTAPVGSFAPNAFGLYDMVGNVWEMVADCYHNSYQGAPADGSAWTSGGHCASRVLRGGSWGDGVDDVRSALRLGGYTGGHTSGLGFRVARTLTP